MSCSYQGWNHYFLRILAMKNIEGLWEHHASCRSNTRADFAKVSLYQIRKIFSSFINFSTVTRPVIFTRLSGGQTYFNTAGSVLQFVKNVHFLSKKWTRMKTKRTLPPKQMSWPDMDRYISRAKVRTVVLSMRTFICSLKFSVHAQVMVTQNRRCYC